MCFLCSNPLGLVYQHITISSWVHTVVIFVAAFQTGRINAHTHIHKPGFYLGFNFFFWGGGAGVLQGMIATQDMHVDLMQVLYVYSRVHDGEICHVCICDILDIYKTHACTVRIEEHADMCME